MSLVFRCKLSGHGLTAIDISPVVEVKLVAEISIEPHVTNNSQDSSVRGASAAERLLI